MKIFVKKKDLIRQAMPATFPKGKAFFIWLLLHGSPAVGIHIRLLGRDDLGFVMTAVLAVSSRLARFERGCFLVGLPLSELMAGCFALGSGASLTGLGIGTGSVIKIVSERIAIGEGIGLAYSTAGAGLVVNSRVGTGSNGFKSNLGLLGKKECVSVSERSSQYVLTNSTLLSLGLRSGCAGSMSLYRVGLCTHLTPVSVTVRILITVSLGVILVSERINRRGLISQALFTDPLLRSLVLTIGILNYFPGAEAVSLSRIGIYLCIGSITVITLCSLGAVILAGSIVV